MAVVIKNIIDLCENNNISDKKWAINGISVICGKMPLPRYIDGWFLYTTNRHTIGLSSQRFVLYNDDLGVLCFMDTCKKDGNYEHNLHYYKSNNDGEFISDKYLSFVTLDKMDLLNMSINTCNNYLILGICDKDENKACDIYVGDMNVCVNDQSNLYKDKSLYKGLLKNN